MLVSETRCIRLHSQKRFFIGLVKPLATTVFSHTLFNKEIVSANNVEYSSDETKTFLNTAKKEDDINRLYPDHIPLNCFAKNMVFVKSALGSFFKPNNNIHINQLGETIPLWTNAWLQSS